MDREFEAVVEKIVREGPHGPFVIASNGELGSVTFSLDQDVWLEEDWPEPGTYVVLCKIRRKRAGWRAQQAWFVEPAESKKQGA